jgi:hypothetical protein
MIVLFASPATADNVSIGISSPSVNFGLNIGSPPPLVAVPRLPVYYAPSVSHNYFVYGGYYYLFHEGTWFFSGHYNGPWIALVIHQVPTPILSVPVTYYNIPPGHAKKARPPPWAGSGKGQFKHKSKKWKDDWGGLPVCAAHPKRPAPC